MKKTSENDVKFIVKGTFCKWFLCVYTEFLHSHSQSKMIVIESYFAHAQSSFSHPVFLFAISMYDDFVFN